MSRLSGLQLVIVAAVAITSCSSGSDGNRLADTSSPDAAVQTGLSLLHVRLVHANAEQSQDLAFSTIRYALWDMEVVAQRIGRADRAYSAHGEFFQGLFVYNRTDMVSATTTWGMSSAYPALIEGREYLLVTKGRMPAPFGELPDMFALIPLNSTGGLTGSIFGESVGTSIDALIPMESRTPLLPDDGGVPADAGASDSGVGSRD